MFGQQRRGKASFEARVKLAGARNGRIDCFWPGIFLAEHTSAGADLIRARAQAVDYLTGIRNEELPRYILVCDFAAKAGLLQRLVSTTGLETVERFREVWRREAGHLPMPDVVRAPIETHMAKLPIMGPN